MTPVTNYLIADEQRARWMRFDTAQLLKRFFFCERALLINQASWLPLISSLEAKIGIARSIWQSAETAHALRERVFELRFPSRLLEEEGTDRALIEFIEAARNSPSEMAFLLAVGRVFLPALRDAYREYLRASDSIADGPTHRFLSLSLAEKEEQVACYDQWIADTLSRYPEERDVADSWAKSLAEQLQRIGGVGVGPAGACEMAVVPTGKPYGVPDRPARDQRFWQCRFYWPDVVDPAYPYGEGLQLQLRSAISHLNEVWAIEAGGIILSCFADILPWEWIHNSARWTYDESRHCHMGYERLMAWGLDRAEVPLGTYIYDSASGPDPIYRLGMLYFFETKNIRHKPVRAQLFHSYGDLLSEHDMDFDWADETIHAGYGKHWLKELLKMRGEDAEAHDRIREQCGDLVRAYVNTASQQEIADIKRVAGSLIEKASQRGRLR